MSYNEKLNLTRTLGFEIECFVDEDCVPTYTNDWDETYADLDEFSVNHCDIGEDGSLHGDGVGIEAKTDPISNLNIVEEVFNELNGYGLEVNNTCGLHIHVDTSDFTVADKVRLLRFGAGIELLMFSLVDSSRYYGRNNEQEQNGYCTKLHKGWRKIYKNSYVNKDIHDMSFSSLDNFIYQVRRLRNDNGHDDRIWNGRYQWLNASVGHAPTCEFRIFSSTTDYEQAQKFGMLAYHVIETVKHSTVEQIKFIIKSIYQQTSLEDMFGKFFDSIGLDMEFRPDIQNDRLAQYLDNKYCERNRQAIVGESEAV